MLDSVAFGHGVSDSTTFSNLLGRSSGAFESADLAVPDYGVDQSLLLAGQALKGALLEWPKPLRRAP